MFVWGIWGILEGLEFGGFKVWGFFLYTTTHHISDTKFKVSVKPTGKRNFEVQARLSANHKFKLGTFLDFALFVVSLTY